MRVLLNRAHKALPAALGTLTLVSVGLLLSADAWPRLFLSLPRGLLGALPLVLVALAYLAHQSLRRPRPAELAKAISLAVAFLFWAANQLWSANSHAQLFNDIAIALFVVDVFLVIVGWPRTYPSAFAGDLQQLESRSRGRGVGGG
jgi:hypothetical protein